MPRRVALLGSTGSIGRQTLDVARSFPEEVEIAALATRSNLQGLEAQIREFQPPHAGIVHSDVLPLVDVSAEWHVGQDAMTEIATLPDVDLVVVATSGSGGLMPTLGALRAGKLVALANKETLVMAGAVIREAITDSGAQLVPIDSEHSALWQCLQGEDSTSIERLTLTASGGALRNLGKDELAHVTPEQALQHPTWTMGRKVTIDSATLMNKGLEVIEARWLFDITMDRLDVVLHPQSIVHSLVTFADGAVKAQLGLPDMRMPIQYALSHPRRWTNELPRLDIEETLALEFGPIDLERYPALGVALAAGRQGGVAPAVLCGADEVAVEAFLAGHLPFNRISEVAERCLDAHAHCESPKLDDILDADRWSRQYARRLVSV